MYVSICMCQYVQAQAYITARIYTRTHVSIYLSIHLPLSLSRPPPLALQEGISADDVWSDCRCQPWTKRKITRTHRVIAVENPEGTANLRQPNL